MTFTVESAFDAWIESQPDREPDGMWHPSGLFTCARQAAYTKRGEPKSETRTAASMRPLVVGTMFHELLQQAVSGTDAGQVIHEPLVAMPDLQVTGHADSLILHEEGDAELVEYKSIKSVHFVRKDAKPEHLAQALTYAYGISHYPWYTEPTVRIAGVEPELERHEAVPVTRVRIAYIDKASHEIVEHVVYPTPEWDRSFLTFMSKMNEHEERGTLPDRVELVKGEIPNWPCGWCPYRTKCWEIDEP